MRLNTLRWATVLVVLLLAQGQAAALDACMLVKQGGKEFEGSSKKAGHLKNSSIVRAVQHAVDSPVGGRRHHGPVTVEVLPDPSIYQLYGAWSANKPLDVTLQFYRTNQDNIGLWGAGENAPYYKIHLTDAVVSSIEFVHGPLSTAPASPTGEFVKVKFTYRQIEWTFVQGNKSAQDTWDAR